MTRDWRSTNKYSLSPLLQLHISNTALCHCTPNLLPLIVSINYTSSLNIQVFIILNNTRTNIIITPQCVSQAHSLHSTYRTSHRFTYALSPSHTSDCRLSLGVFTPTHTGLPLLPCMKRSSDVCMHTEAQTLFIRNMKLHSNTHPVLFPFFFLHNFMLTHST